MKEQTSQQFHYQMKKLFQYCVHMHEIISNGKIGSVHRFIKFPATLSIENVVTLHQSVACAKNDHWADC